MYRWVWRVVTVIKLLMCVLLAGVSLPGFGETLKSTEVFVSEAFVESSVPKRATLWLDKDIKQVVSDRIGYDFSQLRIRYWGEPEKTVWILEEIGKERPITIGVVVQDAEIRSVEILEYRESRGDEVKYTFFTDQFVGGQLIDARKGYRLSTHIDGITGATLSVRAVKKVATLALFLHKQTPYYTDAEAT